MTSTAYGKMEIRIDDLTSRIMGSFIEEHLRFSAELSPPESVHALGLDALRKPDVTCWSAWRDGELLGCGALKELNSRHGEIKSMRTSEAHRRQGVASRLLEHIITEARKRDYERLSLETGSTAAFEPARILYESFGFRECGPFADYVEDPNSVFMTRTLSSR